MRGAFGKGRDAAVGTVDAHHVGNAVEPIGLRPVEHGEKPVAVRGVDVVLNVADALIEILGIDQLIKALVEAGDVHILSN